MTQRRGFSESPAMRSSEAATGIPSRMRASSTSTTTGTTTRTTTSASADPRNNRLDAGTPDGRNTLGRESPGAQAPKARQHAQPKTAALLTSGAVGCGTKIHIVGFSGGIDSQATAIWVRNRYPNDRIILINTEAGRNESPITRVFVKNYSENVFPVTEVVPLIKDLWKTEGWAETKGLDGNEELTFKGLLQIKGRAPSRTRQFCTTFLKLEPMKRWILENIEDDFERYSGVRRDESNSRKDAPFRYFDEYFDCYANNPLADWTKKMCFDYVTAHGEEYNPLYKLGFGRVGCAPCINSGKEDILLWSQRFPEMIDKIRKYEQEAGCTFFAPCVPGMAMNTIDQVLEWASTGRGGRQQDIIRLIEERPTCESKFGLCE